MKYRGTIAVVGGGITGSVTALTLSDLGYRVVLFDARESVLRMASYVNEGKIHLGLVYINDPTSRSIETMTRSAVVFRNILERWISAADFDGMITDGFDYVVPRDSQLSVEMIVERFGGVEEKVKAAEAATGMNYLGIARDRPLTERIEVARHYNPERIAACFRTGERSVDPHGIAARLGEAIQSRQSIELSLDTKIHQVESCGSRWKLRGMTGSSPERKFGPFEAVVNASWHGRFALDRQVFGPDPIQWFHRYKTALNIESRHPENTNFTAIIGAYGDIVRYPSGRVYLSWYPTGMTSTASDVEKLKTTLNDEEKVSIARSTISALAEMAPGLSEEFADYRPDPADITGGTIIARGNSDIVDRSSELHQRYQIGIRDHQNYISVDTGKYTSGPYFADQCARLIAGRV